MKSGFYCIPYMYADTCIFHGTNIVLYHKNFILLIMQHVCKCHTLYHTVAATI